MGVFAVIWATCEADSSTVALVVVNCGVVTVIVLSFFAAAVEFAACGLAGRASENEEKC